MNELLYYPGFEIKMRNGLNLHFSIWTTFVQSFLICVNRMTHILVKHF